jgi:ComF family protein
MRNAIIDHHALTAGFLNILYPSHCPLCAQSSDTFSHAPICSACWSAIKRYNGPSCEVCALPVVSEYSHICGQCIKKKPPFSRAIAYGLYGDPLAEAINQLKFYGIKRIGRGLGSLLTGLDLPQADGIVPVPLTIKRLREREFNQALLIGRSVSKKTGIPLFIDILTKKKETPPQIGLSAAERMANLKNAFAVTGNINSLRLILIDDVMTTGATVTECSRALLKAGAKEVSVLVVARAGLV